MYLSGILASALGGLIIIFINNYLNSEKKRQLRLDSIEAKLEKWGGDMEDLILSIEKGLTAKLNETSSSLKICQMGEGKDLEQLKSKVEEMRVTIYATRELATTMNIRLTKLER
jgi:outer membrane murein-binding lipoprotein Lpp